MIKILTKYIPGDKVYTITQVPFMKKVICELCEGDGTVKHKKHVIKCPNCKGEDVFQETKFKVWEAVEVPQKISAINLKFLREDTYKVAYKINGSKRAEENLFETLEEAYDKCNQLNNVLNYKSPFEENKDEKKNEIIINNKFDLNDLVYTVLPKNMEYDEEEIKSNPCKIREIRGTIGPDHIEVRYKVDMGFKFVNRAENNVFKSYDELCDRLKEIELESTSKIENENVGDE